MWVNHCTYNQFPHLVPYRVVQSSEHDRFGMQQMARSWRGLAGVYYGEAVFFQPDQTQTDV